MIVLGVQVWTKENPMQRAKEFARKHKLTFPVLVDAEDKLTSTYGLAAVPTNVIIGRDGRIRYLRTGFSDLELGQAIEAALKE